MKINKLIELPFFLGAKSAVFENARQLRNNMTEAEELLWKRLRKGQLFELHFRRQHPISQFVADFYCHKILLVIDVDGEMHKQPYHLERDRERSNYMQEHGITVLRFTNKQILEDIENVVNEITLNIEYLRRKLK